MSFRNRWIEETFLASLPKDTITETWDPGYETVLMDSDSPAMFYLERGKVQVILHSSPGCNDGTPIIVEAGQFVGEMGFLQGTKRCATVKALSRCIIRMIPESAIKEIVAQVPFWFAVLVDNLIDRVRNDNAIIREAKK